MSVIAVQARGLVRRHRIRHDEVLATDGVDLELRAGEILGLLGPNGAGKTTLVRLLVGLLAPESGTVELFGEPATPTAMALCVAYVGQHEPTLDEVPVGLAVEQTARLRGLSRREARAACDQVLDELGLVELAGRPFGHLSGGQRRLASVATGLVGERRVLILDEPTTGLDLQARRAVWDVLERRRAAGAAVLLVTHNVTEAEVALDRVVVMSAGRVLACDTPGRVKAMVGDDVRLELVWRSEPPDDEVVEALRERCRVSGHRWTVHMPADEARAVLGWVTGGTALGALDDFTLATPTLEDAYVALGGASGAWEAA